MDDEAIEKAYLVAELADALGYHKTSDSILEIVRKVSLLGPKHQPSKLSGFVIERKEFRQVSYKRMD